MYAAIIAGGSGTRFWPLSREDMPKQLLSIGEKNTLIQGTVSRVSHVIPLRQVYVVTNKKQVESINFQLSESTGILWDKNFVVEPMARNTAPAIGLAAVHLNRLDPEAIMVVLPSDHIIKDTDKFHKTLLVGADMAMEDYLVTIGIKPNSPETGYGYVKRGKEIKKGVYSVDRFKEKPDRETAAKYLKDGSYYWNSGMFIWKAKAILAAIKKHMPDLYKGLMAIEKAIGSKKEAETAKAVFSKLPSESIDYGVIEKAGNIAIVPTDIGWSDVGSWHALEYILPLDSDNNVKHGNVISIESKNSIFYCGKRVVAAIGLDDMIVVDTADATLICPKGRAQDVRKIVDVLKERGSEEYITHKTVYRPWGSYTVLESGNRFKIKRIAVKPGAKLSHQMHHHRSEHWIVVAGTARVSNGDKVYDVHPNESTYIPMSTGHRLENPGKVALEIIEVQNGEYLEEDDIVRFEDMYNRKTES
ncbi:MAG: mannose-1-phosphate guanylyltransferase/mannose-6-phosphate isomerase [Nitrospirae bacterium]|nr:mannose-1-phosphate guanylyltransferase/mannose-6-phosphate isomerase [Nitrospirota bacterium]